MIDIKEAVQRFQTEYPDLKVDLVSDVGDEWVFGFVDRETGAELEFSPIAMDKEFGTFRTFFPPDEDKAEDAVEVPVSSYSDVLL